MLLVVIIFAWIVIGFVITKREVKQAAYTMPNHPIAQVGIYIGGIIINPLFSVVVLIEMIDNRRKAH